MTYSLFFVQGTKIEAPCGIFHVNQQGLGVVQKKKRKKMEE